MDLLPWDQLGIGSGWAIVAFGVYRMMIGKLVPRSSLEDKIHEANEWRTESRIKDQQIVEKDIQLRHLEEVGTTVDRIMRSIDRKARNGNTEEGT